jgi:serine/threonine protein kinase
MAAALYSSPNPSSSSSSPVGSRGAISQDWLDKEVKKVDALASKYIGKNISIFLGCSPELGLARSHIIFPTGEFYTVMDNEEDPLLYGLDRQVRFAYWGRDVSPLVATISLLKKEMIDDEIKVAQLFKDHPRFVQIHHDYSNQMLSVIFQDFCNQGSLQNLLDNKTFATLKEHEILLLFKDLFEGLVIMHKKGWVHNDLTLSNLFVHKDEGQFRLKIGNFSMARRAETENDFKKDVRNAALQLVELVKNTSLSTHELISWFERIAASKPEERPKASIIYSQIEGFYRKSLLAEDDPLPKRVCVHQISDSLSLEL